MSKSSKTFVRDATGLVREIGFLDYLITNFNGVTFFWSIAFTPWVIWFAVPGGDVVIGSIGGFILSLFGTIVVFAMMSATFPRSAAPYVANSRVLHPAVGWPTEVLQWLSAAPLGLATIATSLIAAGLIPGLYTMGVSSGNSGLVNAAFALTQPFWLAVLGVLAVLGTMGLAIFGTRFLVRSFQWPMTILMFVGTLVAVSYWSSASLNHLQAVLPRYTNTTYAGILNYANTNYPAAMVPVNYAALPVVISILFTVGAFNSYWGVWAAGEVKRGNVVRTNYLSMAIPCVVLFAVTISTLILAQASVGRDFLLAFTQILTYNPGFMTTLPAVTGFSTLFLIPMMLADNPVAQFLIMMGVVGAVLATSVYTWLIVTREFFAWSFDRLLPAKFAEVSDRTHTPVFSIAINGVIACIFAIVIAYGASYIPYAYVAAFVLSVGPIGILMLSALFIPLRKELWSTSPASKYKILGLPVISIAAVLGLFFQFGAVYYYIVTAGFGWGAQASEFLVATLIIPFILYWIVRRVRVSQGIDIDLVFRSIPPE